MFLFYSIVGLSVASIYGKINPNYFLFNLFSYRFAHQGVIPSDRSKLSSCFSRTNRYNSNIFLKI